MQKFSKAEKQDWDQFYGQCKEEEEAAAEMLPGDAKPAMIYKMIVIDNDMVTDAAVNGNSMTGHPHVTNGKGGISQSDGAASLTMASEYRRVCSKANVTTCAPRCNARSDSFQLSILIDGRSTVMTCALEKGVFSWEGQSALGSCITTRAETWLENIETHAAGTFVLELVASVTVSSSANSVSGQVAMLHGLLTEMDPVVWKYEGPDPAFVVGLGSELDVHRVVVAATSNLAFR